MKRKSTKINRECISCRKAFLAFPSTLKKGHGKYCSNKCRLFIKSPSWIESIKRANKGNSYAKGHIVSEQARLNISTRLKGRKLTESHKYNIANSVKLTKSKTAKYRTIDKDGYVLVLSNSDSKRKNGYILEHRKVMEEKIGRVLKQSEVVHHIDGNKTNNKIDNLELCNNTSEHIKVNHQKERDYMGRFKKTLYRTTNMLECKGEKN